MPTFQLTTPVALIIFNRPDTTERVFAEIARARPPKLLVVGDGPRACRAGEAANVAVTRDIINRVDWPCEVLTNFSDVNLGCKARVSSGLDWVFEQVPEAIILEDDCLPHPTFFRFCQELLERYRDDQRIGMISGDNFQFGLSRTSDSYYFSRYNHIWGWASWRRSWKNYDVNALIWPEIRDKECLKGITKSSAEINFWTAVFNSVFDKKLDTWDYQWVLTSMAQGSLSITPNVNLIKNIGFGAGATHTLSKSIYANLEVKEMAFPLHHPKIFLPNFLADIFVANGQFRKFSIFKRTYNKLFGYLFQ